METRDITTLPQLEEAARTVLLQLSHQRKEAGAMVLGLKGDLGTGKTTFVQTFAQLLGVEEMVTSPTFTIMKRYATKPGAIFSTLVHVDAYRIESTEEMAVLRFEDILREKSTILCIEWPERIVQILPPDTIILTFSLKTTRERTLTFAL